MSIDSHICTVNEVGPSTNNAGETSQPVVMVNLTTVPPVAFGGFEGVWFYVADGTQSDMLAVAIAAITHRMWVHVFVDTPDIQSGTATKCYNMYLRAPV